MEIRQLENFYHACEEMSFTNAAKKSYMTQQGLSKSIALLERSLGVELFTRSSNKLQLTECGIYLYERCKVLFNFLDETIDTISSIGDTTAQKLVIGYNKGACDTLPPEFLPVFRGRCENTVISFRENRLADCETKVSEGELPFAIVLGTPTSKKNQVVLTKELQVSLFLRQEHALAEKERITLEDLQNYTLISSMDKEAFGQSANLLRQKCNVCTVPNIVSMRNYCLNSNDIGVGFPSMQATMNLEGLVVRQLDEDSVRWRTSVIQKKNAELTYTESRFLRCLHNAMLAAEQDG